MAALTRAHRNSHFLFLLSSLIAGYKRSDSNMLIRLNKISQSKNGL
jgi:hypothetical protein